MAIYIWRRVVAKQQVHNEKTEMPFFSVIPVDFVATAKQRFEEFADVQTDLLKAFQETNEHWRNRMAVEAKVEGDFASKLTSVRSIPDAMIACQEWGSRRLEMMAEDAVHFFDDTQKCMQTSARLFANGWATTSGPDVST